MGNIVKLDLCLTQVWFWFKLIFWVLLMKTNNLQER